jgi:hypothetical protein
LYNTSDDGNNAVNGDYDDKYYYANGDGGDYNKVILMSV